MCDWTIKLSCPRCGEATTPVTHGRPTDGGTRIVAVIECSVCRAEWMMSVPLTAVSAGRPNTTEWILRHAPRRFTVGQLADLPGSPQRGSIGTTLTRLADEGRLRRVGGDPMVWELA